MDIEKRLIIINCMIDTIERTTDMENVYNDKLHNQEADHSVPMSDMYVLRDDIINDNHTD